MNTLAVGSREEKREEVTETENESSICLLDGVERAEVEDTKRWLFFSSKEEGNGKREADKALAMSIPITRLPPSCAPSSFLR